MNSKASSPLHSKLLIVVLAECIVFAALWLWNQYVATYSTIILSGVMFVILLFSLVADLIEKSRIPKWYYYVLVISIVVPLVVGMFFAYIYGGELSWMK